MEKTVGEVRVLETEEGFRVEFGGEEAKGASEEMERRSDLLSAVLLGEGTTPPPPFFSLLQNQLINVRLDLLRD